MLVGTKEGHLLQYKIKRGTGDNKYDVVLERSNKNFGKKPITQLYAVPELFLLISLTENVLSVHDLKTFQLIVCLSRTKGATLFAVDVKNAKTLSGGDQCMLRVCVAVRKKLQIMFWKNKTFHDLEDFTLYEVPKAMCWCKDSICVGFYKREYFLVKVFQNHIFMLLNSGS